ncbi:phosphate ABC transporter substrate-binding protein PstS [Corynebacterium lizhenjunii]|uniref:phosphate ABC transporter substrate-binding protein PstS n=1 Tax=Corynebacterium lizhenjunii TaxID=2709394 RepID=UPI001F3543F8|nr:phosphate ABC transporter substrate-binding protein PstS [Corynebacterium lizhenjunii]
MSYSKTVIPRLLTCAAVALTPLALVACTESSDPATTAADADNITGQLVGEGASSQQNAMSVFQKAFIEAYPKADLSYNASGSGAGIEAFINGTATFAGSDSALKDEQVDQAAARCEGNPAWHLPSTIGPVAIAYHLDGVEETINLSTQNLARIFSGEVTTWNDPAIGADNPGVALPDKDITIIFRSDESGTSDNFQKFLAASTGAWNSEGKQFPDTVGEGANGSAGVADQVEKIDGAITYVEAGFAQGRENIRVATVDFGSGPVELNNQTVEAALDSLAFKDTDSPHNMVVDTEALFASRGEGAYPLILTTYNIVCSAGYDQSQSDLVKAFFSTALDNQGAQLEQAGFIPVTGTHLQRLRDAVDAIA